MEAILSEMGDGVIVLSQENTVIYANPAASRLLAIPCDELAGKPLPFPCPTTEGAEVALPATGAVLELRVAAVAWQGQAAQLVILRSATPRKQQEAQLALYAQIVEQTHDSIVSTDTEGLITSWNPGAQRLFGYTEAEMLGQPIAKIYPAEQHEFLREHIIGQVLARKSLALEVTAIDKHGERVEIYLSLSLLAHPDGTVYGLIGYALDITERKRIEREARSLNARLEELLQREQQARADAESQRTFLRVVLDQAPAMMCILSGAEMVYEYANEAYCKMFKRPEADFIGKSIREIFPGEAEAGFLDEMDQVYRSGVPFGVVNELYQHDANDDGVLEDLYFTFSCQPIRAAGGQVIGLLVYLTDVTQSVLARQAIEQKTGEVARLNRELEARVAERTAQLQLANAELEAFAYSVSHDLRAPLRRIDGFSQALVEDCADELDEEGLHYLVRIRAASQHMGELIDDLLALSRVSRLELRAGAVDLSAMARRILADLQAQEPERQVAVTVAPGMRAWGDESFLWIALENLLENAWKFTGKTDGAAIEVRALAREGEQVFSVCDNGAGFDPKYRNKLFETFNRLHTPAEFPGTGIGLATVRRVIERHGGRIWAEGAVGRGATFSFTLPVP